MPYRPADFRLIVVKLYYIDELNNSSYNIIIIVETYTENRQNKEGKEDTITIELTIIKNNESNGDTEQATKPIKKRGRSRPRKNVINTSATENTTYITIKEQADYELSLKLC
jgi:hypothetical protein